MSPQDTYQGEELLRDPRGLQRVPLSIQQSTNQYTCIRKPLKARKITPQKVRKDQCLFPLERQEKGTVHEALVSYPGRSHLPNVVESNQPDTEHCSTSN